MSDNNFLRGLKNIAILAADTARQQSRDRMFFVVFLFGGAMTLASLLFGAVSADQEIEVIRDLGLLTIELFGLATAILGATTLLLSEIESRAVYVILARPFPRWQYIVGRALGLWAAVAAAVAVMGLVHAGLFLLKGGALDRALLTVYPFVGLKLAVATSLGVVLSVFTTSSASALVTSVFLWMTGHFITEARFMAEKAGPLAGGILRGFLLVVPDLQLLNARDALSIPGGGIAFLPAFAHAAGYMTVCLALAAAMFSRKEF